MKKLAALTVVIIMVITLAMTLTACGNGSVTPEPRVVATPTPTPEATPEQQVEDTPEPEMEDYANVLGEFTGFYQFAAIELGAYIDDVVNALGNPTSTMTMDIGGAESTTKSWWTTNFFRLSTSETVTFTDGYATSVMSTADASSTITVNEFEQVSTGMSELDVFEILGIPYSVTIIELMGTTSTTVMWINADFSSGTVGFTDGVVSSTMNMNLT